jgi:hypothetical protein
MAGRCEGLRKQEGLELKCTHQSLVYTDGVNLLNENMNAVGRNTDAQIDASKAVDLEVKRSGNISLPECTKP